MQKYSFFLLAFLFFIFANNIQSQNNIKVEVIQVEDLENILALEDDTVRIVNFWATWCGPCVKEMPDFEEFRVDYSNKKVKLIFISLDWLEHLDGKVIPFLEKKNIGGKVMLLDDVNYDAWLPKVDKRWGGSIPATLVYGGGKNGEHYFHEGMMKYKDLEKVVEKYL